VGQIAKVKGCRVGTESMDSSDDRLCSSPLTWPFLLAVGIAGAEDKCKWLVDELGFDAAINYKGKSPDQIDEEIRRTCPTGTSLWSLGQQRGVKRIQAERGILSFRVRQAWTYSLITWAAISSTSRSRESGEVHSTSNIEERIFTPLTLVSGQVHVLLCAARSLNTIPPRP